MYIVEPVHVDLGCKKASEGVGGDRVAASATATARNIRIDGDGEV